MVANWEVEPVRLNGLLDTSDHHTDVVGVILAGVKVCVISDEDGHVHFETFGFENRSCLQWCAQTAFGAENLLKTSANLESISLSECSEFVQC